MPHRLLHFIFFQVAWFAIVLIGRTDYAVLSLLVAIMMLLSSASLQKIGKTALGMCLLIVVCGLSVDSMLIAFDIMLPRPQSVLLLDLIPVWLIALWLIFAPQYFWSLDWIRLQVFPLALLGGVGGMSAYYAASKMQVVDFASPLYFSLGIIFLSWAMQFALFHSISRKIAH
jgi:hypothetical protein